MKLYPSQKEQELMSLYPYQEEGARFLAANRVAYLADDPGLGKTAQVVVACRRMGTEGVLVVCPAVAVPVWYQEWGKWWPDFSGTGPAVVSYSKLSRSGPPVAGSDAVVLDEAHYCKTISAKRTKAALSLAAAASYAWLLSGSPCPNADPRELWPVFRYLRPDLVPDGVTTQYEWLDRYARHIPTQYGRKVVGTRNPGELRRMLDAFPLLRRKAKDVLDLPPLRVHSVPLPEDRKLTEKLEALAAARGVDDIETATTRRLLGQYKAVPVARLIVDEMSQGVYRAIVVMYHHRDTGALLRDTFAKAGLAVYGFDGSVPQQARADQVEAFQEATRPSVFVVQQQAGGTAITLTRANEIVLVEPDWSPEVNRQAILRVHRIGQTDRVRARVFSMGGSLDEAIMNNLARKIQMREEVLSDG